MTDYPSIAEFASNLAHQAGRMVVEERESGSLRHDYKDQVELVTHADVKVDEFITRAIEARFPDHRILSEESFPDLAKAAELETPLWIVDPIDGTVNYSYGHDQVAVSIAYAERGRIQVGVVHNPFRQECFEAVRGQGATLNGEAIRVSGCNELRKALVATGFPYHKDALAPLVKRVGNVLEACRDIRRLGSAALDICWVACGRLDVYYETVSPWDFAAAWLIAAEAGARCGHFTPVPEGQPVELWSQDLLICSPALFEPMLPLLQLD
ncbi:inositol monophosphatase family protein [Marinobacteraceae bacterium S3BR75-40.1]